MRRAFITGAAGFAGSYLVEECLAAGYEVHGTCAPGGSSGNVPVGAISYTVDLQQPADVRALIAQVRPDRVFHLAGQAALGAAWADPAATLSANILITQHVLDAVHRGAPEARVLAVGSSEVYGIVDPSDMPVVETHPMRPVDPYGVSKAAADLLAQQHHLAFHMHVVRVRPFNHIGPRQRKGFVLPDFAAGIVAIERGEAPPVLAVGNLNSARDFTDVRDVVRAYYLALEHGTAGAVYNVCSGVARPIGELLDALLSACRVPVRVEVDPARYRPVDRPAIVGSYAALREATGWEPAIPLTQTVIDTLDFWRAQR